MRPIYLDHNATTPVLPEVAEAVRHAEAVAFGNPSSSHAAGRKARQALEDARERIAALLGAHPDEVTFTSGATEANNLAVLSWASAGLPFAAASHLEHPCVIEPLRKLEAGNVRLAWWPVDARGVVRPAPLAEPALVCVMLANHETGAIQPVRDVAAALPPGSHLHCDAAQAVGKVPVSFRELGTHTLTASGHKFGGPKGVGVLVARRETPVRPLLFGGHQQKGIRPGTEPVPLAVGMAVALEQASRNWTANREKLETLRVRLWERLHALAAPVVLNGPEIGAADCVPTTLNLSFPGCRADLLLMALDLAGVACSTGSACSSGSLLPSPVLRAMGVPEAVLRSALRFSFAPTVGLADLDEAADRIGAAVRRMRDSNGAG
jgi:cysteine desulfurase